ncbi:MAG: hypothetical protein AB3X44_10960 [Leptothrix sp. (in: b-proteobacteria)]
MKRLLFFGFILAGTLASSLISAPASGQTSAATWHALLYAPNTDYVEVQVNTRHMAPNKLMRNIIVSVQFFDQTSRSLGVARFSFDSEEPKVLTAGGLYRRFFRQPYSRATFARGMELIDSSQATGAQFDTMGLRASPDALIDPADAGTPGAPPAKQ